MNNAIETFVRNGHRVALYHHDDADNPYEEMQQLGEVILYERAELRFGWTTNQEYAALLNDGMSRVRTAKNLGEAIAIVCRWLRAFHGVTVALPFGALDHSGVRVYLGTGAAFGDVGGWDSAWVGLVIDTPKTREDCGTPPELIEEVLRAEFDEFESWIAGDVYGYVITDANGDNADSRWRLIGWDFAKQEAQDAVARLTPPPTVKFTATIEVEVDKSAWATEYNIQPDDVLQDIHAYYETTDDLTSSFASVQPPLFGPLGRVTRVAVHMPQPIEWKRG